MEFKSKYYKTKDDYKNEIPFLQAEDLDLKRIEDNENALFVFYMMLFF